jgi:hypothetical protein
MITEVDDFEKEILRKIDNNELLTGDEIENILDGNYGVDSRIIGSGSWFDYMKTIIQLGGRTFSITWKRGLTEMNESSFESQLPIEVEQTTKMIQVTEWVKLEK